MSYLQLDLTAFDQLQSLTFRAGLPDEDRAIGGLTRLWLQCWRAKTAIVDLLDVCVAFRVRSQDERATDMLLEALEAYGFIRKDDDADGFFLVRGAEKRLGLLKARQKAAAHMRGKGAPEAQEAPISQPEPLPVDFGAPASAQPPTSPPAGHVAQALGLPPDATPKDPKHAAELLRRFTKSFIKQPEAPNASAESGRDSENEPRTEATTVSKERAAPTQEEAGNGATGPGSEHQQLVDAIGESYQRIKGAKYAWSGRDFAGLKKLKTKGPPLEIVARWELALQAQGYRNCTAVYEFAERWNAYPVKWVDGAAEAEDFDQRPHQEKKKARL